MLTANITYLHTCVEKKLLKYCCISLRGEETVEILLYKPAWSHDYKFGVEILLNRMEIYKPA